MLAIEPVRIGKILQRSIGSLNIGVLRADAKAFDDSFAVFFHDAKSRPVTDFDLLEVFGSLFTDIHQNGLSIVCQEFDLNLFCLKIDRGDVFGHKIKPIFFRATLGPD